MNCTNVNLEYKSANKALTTELDRYKEEVKDLKERQNVENSFSGSNEQYAEIERLKQTLSEQVQEKDSLMKTVSDLKNDLKMEENRNIDREIALEKKIKQLDNIIFKRELKDIFNNFNQYLVDELADVQNVFYQMEQAVEQHRLESKTFEVKMNQVLSENERLLAQAIDHR
ncbi:hypothetical protein Tco_0909259 [Tanacetum coccineum]|uniref:Uncharacterized protein n=1 Tax=Tanacetum coccineum TaxID=301880 RepID=A0ABQ5CQH7_9ASTR